MKVVLTHGYFLAEDPKEQKIMKPYPPLGLLYLAAWLDEQGLSNEVFDTTFSTKSKVFTYLENSLPEVIGIYTNLMTKVTVIEMVKRIKGHPKLKDSVVVLGGPDIRYNIEDYLATGADITVFGEGEITMAEIVQNVQRGNKTEFAHIPGLAYLSDGQLIQTAERQRFRPIDDLPVPARHKIEIKAYLDAWKSHHGYSSMTVSTQRGCPYTCKWCSTAVYGQSYRRRSPEQVVNELQHIQDHYAPDAIWFVDDVFSVSHEWLKAFRDQVIERNLTLKYECITRADRMNEQVIQWLKESGCFRVWIGAESGSQKVLDLMDRRVDVQQVRDMIRLSSQAGIETGTFIMLGYPGETERDIQETIDHLKESNPDHFTITIAYPIKGTPLYEHIDEDQNQTLDWTTSSDRDRLLQTTYSKPYYRYAVKWVENEFKAFKLKRKSSTPFDLASIKHRIKAIAARRFMNWYR